MATEVSEKGSAAAERLSTASRFVVIGAFLAGLGVMLLDPFSFGRLGGLAAWVGGGVGVVVVAALGAMLLGRGGMPEEEFQRIARRSERMARMPAEGGEPSEFDRLVVEAIDRLPADFQDVLADVPIVISQRGHEFGAYGHYIGDTVARDDFHDRIVVYQDTLERDFGWDPELLRAQITRTVFHEVAHHLGWNESGVRGLGL